MDGPRWNDEMKFELLRLRSEMRTENFRVLATPLGLGRIHGQQQGPAPSLFPALRPSSAMPSAWSVKHNPQPPAESKRENASSGILAPPQIREEPALEAEDRSRPLWLTWILVHLFDLGFVLLCLGMGFLALGLVIDPSHMSWRADQLIQAIPVQVLARLEAWTLVVGVYLIFGLYWLFFKIVAGHTLGESLLPRGKGEEVAAAPDNVSGET